MEYRKYVVIKVNSCAGGLAEVTDEYGEMKSVLKQRFGENVKIKEFAPKKKLFGLSNLFSGAIDIFINKIEERISFKKFGL